MNWQSKIQNRTTYAPTSINLKDIEFKREKFDPLPGKSIERKFMYFFGPYNPKANYKMSLDYNEDEKKIFERKPIEEP